ncbi:MAG: decarboxylating 6-phosphogluconate dehydrogenase [Elusimicrobiales bacterium]|nr:decarboxylating 6-phosphogluconate dehydrogenase [Elusimicrobiales bacterium]
MKKEIIVVGLGKMGFGIAKRLLSRGYIPYVFNRDYNKVLEISKFGAKPIKDILEFKKIDSDLKIVWLMLPAGNITDEYIKLFSDILSKGDIVIDGSNSNWKNSIKNSKFLEDKGIYFLDVGVSGGIWGEKNGYCMMIGGNEKAFKMVEEYLNVLSENKSYLYCGESGAGHFIKMVHNAVEYVIMEAYAEGFDMIDNFKAMKTNKREIAKLWNKNSVIRSWLLELIIRVLEKDNNLSDVVGYVEDSGEGRWAVEYAVENGIVADAIAFSLFRRFRSRIKNPFSERLVAALRGEFGGHNILRE